MLVSKLCDFWLQAVSSRFSNNQNHYFIDFWLGSWRLRGRKNVSVGHETSIPSFEKVLASSFSSKGLFFSLVWQLSDLRKEKSSLGKGSWASSFSSRGYTCFWPYRTFIPIRLYQTHNLIMLLIILYLSLIIYTLTCLN